MPKKYQRTSKVTSHVLVGRRVLATVRDLDCLVAACVDACRESRANRGDNKVAIPNSDVSRSRNTRTREHERMAGQSPLTANIWLCVGLGGKK
jgi:hypothetical protein